MAILPFLMAVILVGGKEQGTWNEVVLQWSPLPWMYKFYYLKYLFIILPGTLAGDWLLTYKYLNIIFSKGDTGQKEYRPHLPYYLLRLL